MKTIFFKIFLLFFILSACGGPNRGEESVNLAGIIFVICAIVITIILRPFFSIMEKSEDIKNKKMGQFLFAFSIICIIVILFNLDKIFVFIFKPLVNLFR
jgi:hypothetical protein